uniref:WGS project CBMG000000000 data, contig CS5907-c003624 n=1 Tax=Fusarium acuminatum CS5907 TaxID=1318461 RepID=A0A090ME51_9HYPO|nr:unnamed protein product [Fusarium acuminatum CS5907]
MVRRIGRRFDERINWTPRRSIKELISKYRRAELTSDLERSRKIKWKLTSRELAFDIQQGNIPQKPRGLLTRRPRRSVLITSRHLDFIRASDTVLKTVWPYF